LISMYWVHRNFSTFNISNVSELSCPSRCATASLWFLLRY
jgi:hypothetical protein